MKLLKGSLLMPLFSPHRCLTCLPLETNPNCHGKELLKKIEVRGAESRAHVWHAAGPNSIPSSKKEKKN
jgi:hypothetical protein